MMEHDEFELLKSIDQRLLDLTILLVAQTGKIAPAQADKAVNVVVERLFESSRPS